MQKYGLIGRLAEIGLDESEVAQFDANGDNRQKQIEILKKTRYRILDSVHEQEKKIQQIDYLIHEIKKGIYI